MSAPQDATTYPPAELDRRFYAFTIDRLLAWSLYAAASYAAYVWLLEPGNVAGGVALIAGTVLLLGLLSALLLGLKGTSPGKALVGLRVVEDESGRPIGVARALLRTLVLGIATLPTAGLGVATLAWTAVMDPANQRRGWHDHLSHGVVVDVRPVPEVEEEEDVRPRQLVNLTAMRLVPAPAAAPVATPARAPKPSSPPAPRAPRPAAPPPPAPVAAPAAPAPPPAPPAPAPAPAPAPRHAAPVAAPPSPAPPSPPAQPAPAPAAAPAAPTRVSQLGPPLVPEPSQVPHWRVTFDTGETFVVEGLALVGRRPEARAGETVAHLVPLRSTDMSLSKTHAQFQATPAGALVVMDRGSTNGSIVIRQGISKALTAGRPTTLLAGDTVRFGDRQMTVERA
ncbi:RDD family protein [Nocardioides sp. cx-173]|uniref:RDD family protein n=1 Tax=Nocardioides sp. cx-173 TaxID=2898796 RepID=UPI001E616795|nr:RDD family protein [Nocardioides sp. cx-173]MCD4525626.1 RDD family protein [Nocardioides sp. cx-173]UGB42767.1 RDD family protein [Nocardioides sp. cx-173]